MGVWAERVDAPAWGRPVLRASLQGWREVQDEVSYEPRLVVVPQTKGSSLDETCARLLARGLPQGLDSHDLLAGPWVSVSGRGGEHEGCGLRGGLQVEGGGASQMGGRIAGTGTYVVELCSTGVLHSCRRRRRRRVVVRTKR